MRNHELTDLQKFNLFVYMVKKHSVEELVNRIKQRNVITKQTVISESKFADHFSSTPSDQQM